MMVEDGAGARRGQAGAAPDHSDEAVQSLPRVAMLLSASSWTFNIRLGRSGREEGEGIIIMGEISYRSVSGDRVVHPARAMVVKADSRKRLELKLSSQDAVVTIPLEPFAMQRLQDRLKDLLSFYGMTLRVSFQAAETADRQGLEAVDFAFSSNPTTRPTGSGGRAA